MYRNLAGGLKVFFIYIHLPLLFWKLIQLVELNNLPTASTALWFFRWGNASAFGWCGCHCAQIICAWILVVACSGHAEGAYSLENSSATCPMKEEDWNTWHILRMLALHEVTFKQGNPRTCFLSSWVGEHTSVLTPFDTHTIAVLSHGQTEVNLTSEVSRVKKGEPMNL